MAVAREDAKHTLRKILEHEDRLGCKDSAVSGGLEAFARRWADRLPPEEAALGRHLAPLLAGYAGLAPAERQRRIKAALQRLATPGADGVAPARAAAAPVAAARQPVAHERPPVPEAGRANGRQAGPARGAASPRGGARRPPAGAPAPAVGAAGGGAASGLDAPVTRLRGISGGYARLLGRLGIATVRDLLYHFPRRHIDYRQTKPISALTAGETESVLATIWEVHARRARSGLPVIEMVAGDETGMVGAVWFNQPHLAKSLPANRQIALSGRVEVGPQGQPYFKSPDWELIGDEELVHAGRLVPVYPLTEGLSGRWLRRLIKSTIDRKIGELVDHLPASVRREATLVDLETAVAQMHFPDDERMRERAARRLAFDELFLIQLGVLQRRYEWTERQPGHPFVVDRALLDRFLATLPFQLTGGQQHAGAEILADMARPRPMTRLLQGEVGSGKTVVAAQAMLVAVDNGFQSVLMAPTEILAEQHFRTLGAVFERFGPQYERTGGAATRQGLTVRLLTGSMRKRDKEETYAEAAAGAVDVLVGTHALIQEGLALPRLGLAVVDEQHRFGVEQRAMLRQKGLNPDLLVMTATPIPRTLALTLYGDLDISTIRELPPGRQEVKTLLFGAPQRQTAYEFLRRRVVEGEQAFIICPLVEESEKIEAKAATAEHERLQREVFPELRLGLLHGRMAGRDKEQTMQGFRAGELQVLVSTAVVEVGIDVPNATVMLIEGADRFGLAQLHQFRGRVGRGTAESYCILLSDSPTAESEERLQVLARTRDGCLLAEEDLRLRGPGELFGTRQSGVPDLKVARLGDIALLEEARAIAEGVFARDRELAAPEHRLLGAKVAAFWRGGDVS